MGRTIRQKKPEKELTASKIRSKWSARKKQVRRLKKIIKELEVRLENALLCKAPKKAGKKKKTIEKDDEREYFRAKLKDLYGRTDDA